MKLLIALTTIIFTLGAIIKKDNKSTQMVNKQYPEYINEWAEINKLIEDGLLEDALIKLELLHARSIKEDNKPQVYKTLVIIQKLSSQKDEHYTAGIISRLETKIPSLDIINQALIKSVLATLYFNLANQVNAYGQKSEIAGVEQDTSDINTWSKQKLIRKSNELMLESLRQPESLNEATENFKAVIIESENKEQAPVSLFELLMQRAVNHFCNEQAELTDFNWSVEKDVQFANFEKFIKSDVKAHPVFQLYQDWLKYLIAQNDLKLQIYVNLQRLKYAYRLLGQSNHIYYKESLRQFYIENNASQLSSMILRDLIDYYFTNDNEIEDKKNNYQIADSLCQNGKNIFKDTTSIKYFESIQNAIRRPNLEIFQERIIPANENSKILLNFANLKSIKFRIYKIPLTGLKDIIPPELTLKDGIPSNFKVIREWSDTWKSPDDFKPHSVELKIDPLDLGYYFIEGFDPIKSEENSIKCGSYFLVSNLATFQVSERGENSKIFVVDRNSGQPVSKAKVVFYTYRRDRYDQPPKLNLHSTKVTNKEGFVSSPSKDYLQYYVAKSKDIMTNNEAAHSSYDYNQSDYNQIHFFTDRSLYRPGQTVYFKILAIRYPGNGEYPNIIPNKSFNVILKNPNYQQVQELKLKTNSYGSAQGSFVIPGGGLNGVFTLESLNGSTGIQVDEYKRPNFEIVFDTIKENYKLNDKITVRGVARTFNGIPLESTTVKYRVNRQNYFPFYDLWRSYRPGPMNNEQIEFGSVLTNDKGQFEFTFVARPSIDPVFKESIQQFIAEVDATDQNQETRSGTQSISLSSKSLFVKSNIDSYLLSDNDSLMFQSINIGGIPTRCDLTINVYSLQQPKSFLKERLWAEPDIKRFELDEFKKYFPYDLYSKEDQIEKWNIREKVFSKDYQSVSEVLLSNKFIKSKEGSYRFELVAKSGDHRMDTFYFHTTVLQNKLKNFQPDLFVTKSAIEPNEILNAFFIPSFETSHIYHTLNSKSTNQGGWIKNSSLQNVNYKIKETDRGGMILKSITVIRNRVFQNVKVIEVPWSNKDLGIETISFRDKLLPGHDEEWSFKISNKIKSKERFELLASMYDQSLDQILPHQWNLSVKPVYLDKNNIFSSTVSYGAWLKKYFEDSQPYTIGMNGLSIMPQLNLFGIEQIYFSRMYEAAPMSEGMRTERSGGKPHAKDVSIDAVEDKSSNQVQKTILKEITKSEYSVRKNLNETVFYYPQLLTDSAGNITMKFKMNEAMTKWKLQLFAHSLDLKYGFQTYEVVTRKPIQIRPYYPRFVRQGDDISIFAMISNLSEEKQIGTASINIIDPITLKDITNEFVASSQSQKFDLKVNNNLNLNWQLKIPMDETRSLLMRFSATGNSHNDAEEMLVPVMSNTKLITETLPLPIKGGEKRDFFFESMKRSISAGARPHLFTLEMTSHPVWYAIQALPYMMEYPHECNEQIMSRIFANAIGTTIMRKYPKVAATLKSIQAEGKMQSKLLQNQELKSALIEETPWVLQAQSETEQMQRIALLMDFNTMDESLQQAIARLKQRQNSDGSFSWFPGFYPDRYMTQHIVNQIAHLNRLKIEKNILEPLTQMAIKARGFLDYSIQKEYEELSRQVKEGKRSWDDNNLTSLIIHYFYCKTQFSDWKSEGILSSIDNYYLNQMKNFWIKSNLYDQGICALISYRKGNIDLAKLIMNSLKQRSLHSDELGRFWKNAWSYYWFQQPIETQALMIELFFEIDKDPKIVDELKIWLLKNKQTQHWGTTKSTSEAIFALLAFGDNYVEEFAPVKMMLGNDIVNMTNSSSGTSYFKDSWNKSEIKSDFSNIQLSNPNKSIAWGAAYFQYFQSLDKVEQSDMKELILKKELYLKSDSDKAAKLIPISSTTNIKTGDKVTARIIIKSDRPMDYVHLKVMRSAGLEPINQLSGYQYSGGLSYYLSPRDLSTDFFISYLPKGTFVLEYDMRASFKGKFSDGLSSIQCMYAPEFGAHSKGIKISIE